MLTNTRCLLNSQGVLELLFLEPASQLLEELTPPPLHHGTTAAEAAQLPGAGATAATGMQPKGPPQDPKQQLSMQFCDALQQ